MRRIPSRAASNPSAGTNRIRFSGLTGYGLSAIQFGWHPVRALKIIEVYTFLARGVSTDQGFRYSLLRDISGYEQFCYTFGRRSGRH